MPKGEELGQSLFGLGVEGAPVGLLRCLLKGRPGGLQPGDDHAH